MMSRDKRYHCWKWMDLESSVSLSLGRSATLQRKPFFCESIDVLVLTKTRNNLKPAETTWNYLKPSETTQKLLKTTWNQSHYSIFLLTISYSQIAFVLILHPKVFFGQIWSQKLKFSKLTEIWYRGTLLYTYYDFNVYFSNIFVTRVFRANLVP